MSARLHKSMRVVPADQLLMDRMCDEVRKAVVVDGVREAPVLAQGVREGAERPLAEQGVVPGAVGQESVCEKEVRERERGVGERERCV
eukprot:6197213-Pleurochrysis_carterae.AAC.1